MRAWWSGRSTREQGLIALAAALFGVFLALQIIVKPITEWRNAAGVRAAEAENGYRVVARAASTLAPVAASEEAATPTRNAVIDTARQLQVTLTFVNARADGSVEFQAGPVDPERLFALLSILQKRYGIGVLNADIARSPDNPAQVRLQATLSR